MSRELHILGYKERGNNNHWIAHVLEMDLKSEAKEWIDAFNTLKDMIEIELEYHSENIEKAFEYKAEDGYFDMYFNAGIQGYKRCIHKIEV